VSRYEAVLRSCECRKRVLRNRMRRVSGGDEEEEVEEGSR
jgi:hypothetical protein